MTRNDLPRSVNVPVLRRKLPGAQMGESRKRPVAGRSIIVAPRLKGVVALSTLVHEMVHQMSHQFSERTVRRLEKAIVYLVIDNPDVFRRLLRRCAR